MNYYLVVYSKTWSFNVTAIDGGAFSYGHGSIDTKQETHYYSEMKSLTIQAENRIDAYNKAKAQLKNNESIVHIEQLND